MNCKIALIVVSLNILKQIPIFTYITSRKVDRTNELLEELLGLPGSFVCRKDVLEPVADDPLLLGVLLRRRVDQENAKLETEVCRNEI
jgi:hypothetical protein